MANIIQHLQNGEFSKVLKFCQHELEKKPIDYNLVIVQGWCLYELGRITEATLCMSQWHRADDLHMFTIGLAQDYFFLQEEHEQVIALSKTFIEKKYPNDSHLHYRLALSSGIIGNETQAIDYFRKTLSLKYDPKIEVNLACMLLNRHEYREGFELYEARFNAFPHCNWFLNHVTDIPLWSGESLEQKTVLLWSEQGLGDSIQFCRYANVLADKGAKIKLLLHGAHTSLKGTLSTLDAIKSPDDIYCIHSGDTISFPEGIDFHCPMMSVMKVLNMDQHNIPSGIPYLISTTAHHQQWDFLKHKTDANNKTKFKIGLVWNTQTPTDSQEKKQALGKGVQSKNIRLQELQPLFTGIDADFYSLQYKISDEDKQAMQLYGVIDTSYAIKDFEDTAAIIHHMDLVISIDTAVVHLAGALAKPVVNLLPYVNDWRWQENRDDTPWYPTMKLIRQPERMQWAPVVKELCEYVKKFAGKENIKEHVKQCISAGEFQKAITAQEQLVKESRSQFLLTQDDIETLSYLYFSVKKHDYAYQTLETYKAFLPVNERLCWNKATLLYMMGDYSAAYEAALVADNLFPSYRGGKDILARICGALGLLDKAKAYGEAAMLARDAIALSQQNSAYPVPATPRAFNPLMPKKNIIAYSLWGNDPRYLKNAVENARLSQDFFPHWTLRFYIEEGTNADVIEQLQRYKAEVVIRPKQQLPFEGLFWRFLVINDSEVDYFLIRDADSLFTHKEVAAVEAWLNSGKCFHIMRDHYEQTDLIQAGLWGGVGQVLPSVNTLLPHFKPSAPSKMVDQEFLATFIWPTVKQSVLIHDSFYQTFGAQPYPATDDAAIALGRYEVQDKHDK